jgi:hypothetical protein
MSFWEFARFSPVQCQTPSWWPGTGILWKTLEEGEACSWWGQETFTSDWVLPSTHRQGKSSAGKWGTACPWWHSSYDPGSVLGFSTHELFGMKRFVVPWPGS